MTSRDHRIRFLQLEVIRIEKRERTISADKALVLTELRELGGKRLPRRESLAIPPAKRKEA